MYNIFTELASKLYTGNKNYSNHNPNHIKTVIIPTSTYQLSKEIKCTLLLPYTNKCIKNNNQITKIVNDYHMKNNKNNNFFTGTKIVILGSFTLFCFYLFNKRK